MVGARKETEGVMEGGRKEEIEGHQWKVVSVRTGGGEICQKRG